MLHWADLADQDPDVAVDVMGISTEDLMDAFADKAEAYIEQEFG